MINWNNLDTLEAFKELKETPLVDLNKVMSVSYTHLTLPTNSLV